MAITIGTNIKNLRTKKQVTQKQLATYLGVTEQAVSRWESCGGYPDITMLPSIASFFSVTTDDLLGLNMSEREEKLALIRKKIRNLHETGFDSAETLEEARIWAAEFPGEEDIQAHLADEICRVCMWEDKPKLGLLEEAEKIYLTLTETTADNDFRNNIIESLAALYGVGFRDIGRAEEITNRLPQMKYCREQVKSSVFSTISCSNPNADGIRFTQDYIEKLTDSLGWTMIQYVIQDIPNGSERWDEKIGYLKQILGLYKLVYGDNMLFYHGRAAYICRIISTYTAAQGKDDETFGWLEKMAEHAVLSGQAQVGDKYTSVFTDQLVFPGPTDDFDFPEVHNDAYYFRNNLNQSRYDSIRGSERFKAVLAKLDEYAK